ncbi:hypothetical protein KH0074_11550 [Helicobacter pylori]
MFDKHPKESLSCVFREPINMREVVVQERFKGVFLDLCMGMREVVIQEHSEIFLLDCGMDARKIMV